MATGGTVRHASVAVVRSSAARAVSAAVELVEALSFRVPLPCPVADDDQRLLTGLAEVFDREP